jgi:hypothetical protein
VQNGGQMDQTKPLWEFDIEQTDIYNVSGDKIMSTGDPVNGTTAAPQPVKLKKEKTGTAKQVHYGTDMNFNGNWQPSYYRSKNAAATCGTWEGVYQGNPVYDASGNQYEGGWNNTQTGTPRNRYTSGFVRPSYLMGFHLNWTEVGKDSAVPLPINQTTILDHGPYYTSKDPLYIFNGSALRSASDADFNFYIAYYLADALFKSGDAKWTHDSDINTAITDTEPLPLAHYATGKGVTWEQMKTQIGKSIDENTGGSSNGLYQNSSGNVLQGSVLTGKNLVGLGHDTDISDSPFHADYADLRLFQLLKAQLSTV